MGLSLLSQNFWWELKVLAKQVDGDGAGFRVGVLPSEEERGREREGRGGGEGEEEGRKVVRVG